MDFFFTFLHQVAKTITSKGNEENEKDPLEIETYSSINEMCNTSEKSEINTLDILIQCLEREGDNLDACTSESNKKI